MVLRLRGGGPGEGEKTRSNKKPRLGEVGARKSEGLDEDDVNLKRDNFKEQMVNPENIHWYPTSSFKRPDGWDDKQQVSTDATKRKVLDHLKISKANEESDEDSLDSVVCGKDQPIKKNNDANKTDLDPMMIKFIDNLKLCHQIDIGFFAPPVKAKACMCPCSRQNRKWRKIHDIDIGDHECDKSALTLKGLMAHLKDTGGRFHYAAGVYLEELFYGE